MPSSPIRFLLNGAPHEVRDVDPHTSVLAYVREHLHLTGTKEGCNEGDCGACTVAIAEVTSEGKLSVAPINACIRLLPTIHGKAIFTVEALTMVAPGSRAKRELHPVQQAMLDCHGSQCGFCTPGFVMSLFALFKNDAAPSRERICEAISGNLCRCTGYTPIIEAAQIATSMPANFAQGKADKNHFIENKENIPIPQESYAVSTSRHVAQWLNISASQATTPDAVALEAHIIDALSQLQSQTAQPLNYLAAGKRFIAPRTIAEFSEAVTAHPTAWILAGGTDIGLWINKAMQTNAVMIYTGEVAELRAVSEDASGLRIGAAVPLEAAFRAMNRHYPELAHLWARFASWPIRTSGTLGGNIANGSPIGDSMPALIAMGARVVLRKGEKVRTIPLDALYLDYKKQSRKPGEWVEAILVPARTPGIQFASYKNSKRNEQDISAVCAAFAMRVDHGVISDARVAYGGVAGIPKRAVHTEQALLGKAWNEATVREAMQAMTKDFTPMSDMRASAEYRMQVAQNHLLRFWHELQGEAAPIEARVF